VWRGLARFYRQALQRVRPSWRAVQGGKRLMGQVYDETDNCWAMVVCQWRDTHKASDTWLAPGSYEPEATLVLTVGWVWPKCLDGHLTICGSVMPNADEPQLVGDVTHIPMENVTQMFSLTTHLPINWFEEDIT